MTAEDLPRFLDRALDTARSAASAAHWQDRYRGVLLGVAVGNVLGIPVEGWRRDAILRRFPGGLRDIDAAERDRPWDDDLAQTVLLAEALLDRNPLDLADLAERLVRWQRENGRGIGALTRRVIAELAAGTPATDAARRVWEREGRNAAGNGAVMRCSPVALRRRRSSDHLVEETRQSALITHYDPRCIASAIALNAALVCSLHGVRLDLNELASCLENSGAPSEVSAAIRAVPGAHLEDFDLSDPRTMGYTLKAMQVGLWALVQDADFESVLVAVVHAGGDTDTNGAVAGAIMGSRVGLGGIPQRWLDSIHQRERLVDLADRLFAASEA